MTQADVKTKLQLTRSHESSTHMMFFIPWAAPDAL